MKAFSTLQTCFRQQFIYLNSENQNSTFSWKNALLISTLLQLSLQLLAFLLFKNGTHIELGNSFYMCATATVFIYNHFIYFKKRNDIRKLIEQFNQFTETSKQFFFLLN